MIDPGPIRPDNSPSPAHEQQAEFMNAHERNISTPIDLVKLDRLAEGAIRVGLNLQPGQDLLLTAPSGALPPGRKIAEPAYRAGAGLVTPILPGEAGPPSRDRFGADG